MPHPPSADARMALIVSTSELVRERASRIAAATGYQPVAATADSLQRWDEASIVLVEASHARAVADADPPRRANVWLISDGPVPDQAWRECVGIGGIDAIDLNHHEHWLIDQLSAVHRDRGRGRVIAVTGSCGGVGASTTVAAIARAAIEQQRSTIIVDGDERGGHLDLLLEPVRSGLGWRELQHLGGRVSGDALEAALANYGGVPVVSTARDEAICPVPFEAMRAVIAAAASTFDITIVDIPSSAANAEVAAICDATILVTTTDARGSLAVRRWRTAHDDVPVTIAARTPHRHCLPTTAFTELAEAAPIVWLSEIKRSAERFSRAQSGVLARDRIVDDASELLAGINSRGDS